MPNLFYDIKHIKEQKTMKTLICCYFCQAETMTRKFPLFQFLNGEKKNLEEFGKIHSLESLPTKQKIKFHTFGCQSFKENICQIRFSLNSVHINDHIFVTIKGTKV